MKIKDTKKEEYRGEISIFNELGKYIKVKTMRASSIKRKYEIISIDKTPIIKENPKQKIQLKAQRIRK